MTESPSGWQMVSADIGTGFVKKIRFPDRKLSGSYVKSISPTNGGMDFTEDLVSTEFRLRRSLNAYYNSEGKLDSRLFELTDPAQEEFFIAFLIDRNHPSSIEPFFALTQPGIYLAAAYGNEGRLNTLAYRQEQPGPKKERVLDFQEQLERDPFGGITLLSSLYAEEGEAIFQTHPYNAPIDKEVEVNQRGWTNAQRRTLQNALNAMLDLAGLEKRNLEFDARLNQQQKLALLEGLKKQIGKMFPKKFWAEVKNRPDVIAVVMVASLIATLASILEIREIKRDESALANFYFSIPDENSVHVEVLAKDRAVFLQRDLAYGENFPYDQFFFTFSKAPNGDLLLATTHLGRGRERKWYQVKTQVNPKNILSSLRNPQPENWIRAVADLPAVFSDELMPLIPEGVNPHEFIRRQAINPARPNETPDEQRLNELAGAHVAECPGCIVHFRRMSISLLKALFGDKYGN